MTRILIDKARYTCRCIGNTLCFTNGIVSTCTISFNTDDTFTSINSFILATTGKNER